MRPNDEKTAPPPPKRRAHRATAKPRGGTRRGSGRRLGSSNTLDYGQVRAVKAAGLRVPEGAPQEHRELADEALGVITEIMRGKVPRAFEWTERGDYLPVPLELRGRMAVRIREEVCGDIKRKVEHTFEGQTDEQLEARYRALLAQAADPKAAANEDPEPPEPAE